MEQRNKYVNDLSLWIWESAQMNKADTETIFLTKVKKTKPMFVCVCVKDAILVERASALVYLWREWC